MTIENQGYCKTALGDASLLAVSAWDAIEAEGKRRDPKRARELDRMLKAGEASLGIFVQRIGDDIHLSATVLPPDIATPFPGINSLVVRGPVIHSQAQLDAIAAIDQRNFN